MKLEKDWPEKDPNEHLSASDRVIILLCFLGVVYCLGKLLGLSLPGVAV